MLTYRLVSQFRLRALAVEEESKLALKDDFVDR